MRRAITGLGLAGVLVIASAGTTGARQQTPGDLEVLQLRPNFHVVAGAGSNIGVHTGEDGIIVVDAGAGARTTAVLAAIRSISSAPIRYIINTTADADHVGGNEALAKAGQTLLLPRSFFVPDGFLSGAASILAAEPVLTRMSASDNGGEPAFPPGALPTETFHYARKYMYLNGEGIEVLRQPAAHSDGDSIVFFRRADVIMAGDILDTTRFPVIDVARGGSVQGHIDALNRLVAMAIPSVPIVSREAGTLVVPGHGRICDQLDVVEYRDMLSIVRDRVRDLVAQGRTLEQVQAEAPARGYTRRYGADSGPWTTRQFVEAVYRSLAPVKS